MSTIRNILAAPLAALLLAAAAPAPAHGGHAVEEKRPMSAQGALRVDNLSGSIVIEAWDKNELEVVGELGAGVERVEITGTAESWTVKVVYPDDEDSEGADLSLRVPRGARVEVESVSADTHVAGIRGNLRAATVSGDLVAEVESAEVELRTVSGDIMLGAAARTASLQSVSGDITVEKGRGELNAESVSGSVMVAGGPYDKLGLRAVSGDLGFDGSLGERIVFTAETLSGDVGVLLPGPPNARVTLKTFSGAVGSKWGPAPTDDDRLFEASLGNGAGRIELHSFSGDVQLDKTAR